MSVVNANHVQAMEPTCNPEPIARIGRRDRPHLRVTSVTPAEKSMIVEVYVADVLHSSCYLQAWPSLGYQVKHTVRHPTDAPFVNVRGTVRRLLSAKRFNGLVGLRHADEPVDVLRCGVAVGPCTFFIRAYDGGRYVAVFEDAGRQTLVEASADDWNALIDAWAEDGARYGDAERVRIAERFFRERDWMPAHIRIFSTSGDE